MSRRHNPQPVCNLCNHFMSWRDVRLKSVSWTPFAGPLEYEEPAAEYAHKKCWDAAGESQRARIRAIGWHKPYYRGRAA